VRENRMLSDGIMNKSIFSRGKCLYRRYHKGLKLLLFLFVVVGGVSLFYWQTTQAKVGPQGLWGMADAKESNVNSKVFGRVIEICVNEGDYVEKGQVIARIDQDTQNPQQRQAQATLAAQYAQVQQVALSADSTKGKLNAALKLAEAQLSQAVTARNLAAKDEARYSQLLSENAVPEQTYDSYRSKLDQAESACVAAQAGVDSARFALKENEANKASQNAAEEQAKALKSQLDSANISLNETEIRAPYSGIITKRFVEEGSLISSSVPIYSIQDSSDNWVDFKVKETDLGNYEVGDFVTLEGRNADVHINGTIESIRRKADFATQKATSERGDTDVMAFNVKVRTNDNSIWPGMRFRLRGRNE